MCSLYIAGCVSDIKGLEDYTFLAQYWDGTQSFAHTSLVLAQLRRVKT